MLGVWVLYFIDILYDTLCHYFLSSIKWHECDMVSVLVCKLAECLHFRPHLRKMQNDKHSCLQHLVTCPTEPCLNVCLSCKHYCNIFFLMEQEKEIKSWLELKGVHLLSTSIACHNIIDKTALSFFSSVYDMWQNCFDYGRMTTTRSRL